MGQVTIYLEDSLQKKMTAEAKSKGMSKSKWIARLIEEKVAGQWPQSIVEMAGAWKDFPDLKEIRHGLGHDQDRENL